MKEVKPWTDKGGEPLSEGELKVVSKNWDVDVWEQYLKTLEVPQRESLIRPHKYNKMREHLNEPVFLSGSFNSPKKLKKRLEMAIKTLSEQQKNVIKKIFYENLSEQQVADVLNISRSSVQVHKRKALRHLKNNLHSDSSICPRVKGQQKLWASITDENEEVDL